MRRAAIGVAWALAATVAAAQSPAPDVRVYSSTAQAFSTLEAMAADLAAADVVFIGEQHNDVNTHRVEFALFQAMAKMRGQVFLALEMFERDAQDPLEHFQMGHTDEAEFIREANAWPEYTRDYKPLVDLAIAQKWPVIAANVPRAIAARVAELGLDGLKDRPTSERALVAADIQCPTGDEYYTRFMEAMGGSHSEGAATAPGAMSRAALDRYYFSQCVKDETMAESIAQAHAAGSAGGQRPLVLVVNGTFHSDYRLGTVSRTARRLPGKRVVVLSIVPVRSLEAVRPTESDGRRADYLIYSAR
jgi:uncharacterized iron-regulated protein